MKLINASRSHRVTFGNLNDKASVTDDIELKLSNYQFFKTIILAQKKSYRKISFALFIFVLLGLFILENLTFPTALFGGLICFLIYVYNIKVGLKIKDPYNVWTLPETEIISGVEYQKIKRIEYASVNVKLNIDKNNNEIRYFKDGVLGCHCQEAITDGYYASYTEKRFWCNGVNFPNLKEVKLYSNINSFK